MKISDYIIKSNSKIAEKVYKAVLYGDTSEIKRPGQFINIAIDGLYLRRPISICDYDSESVTIIYKAVGTGTEKMSAMESGQSLNVMTGLGNGFSVENCKGRALLVGGGVGAPPMYRLAKELDNPIVVLGFGSACDVFYEDEFRKLSSDVYITTVDGSAGEKGFVTDVIINLNGYSYTYSCGPEPMLKAVYDIASTDGEYSFEERMGCGFGACMGCSCETKYGAKRICKDGPVLKKEEIIW